VRAVRVELRTAPEEEDDRPMKSALEIAQEAQLRPIAEIASAAGLQADELEQLGLYRGKIRLSALDRLKSKKDGKLVIVTAITPTKAGEGKTTTSVALTMGLGKINKKVMLCLREPSMGPVFGVKGGGTGGGYAQVGPMEDINLHFNGDFHAVTEAHNLLAAALDASIFNGNPLGIDPGSVIWPRAIDMNDRQLRYGVVGLGGKVHGVPREHQFVITAASEVMASFALATDLQDLRSGSAGSWWPAPTRAIR
jgi:formate--tetrahydrofolate ligase